MIYTLAALALSLALLAVIVLYFTGRITHRRYNQATAAGIALLGVANAATGRWWFVALDVVLLAGLALAERARRRAEARP